MKDALGHGSNTRNSMLDVNGKGIMPTRPFREGCAHQVSLAEDHGIPTRHLVPSFDFRGGQRAVKRIRRQGQ